MSSRLAYLLPILGLLGPVSLLGLIEKNDGIQDNYLESLLARTAPALEPTISQAISSPSSQTDGKSQPEPNAGQATAEIAPLDFRSDGSDFSRGNQG